MTLLKFVEMTQGDIRIVSAILVALKTVNA